eukprot:TRINITY_DN199_c0_g1_i3.p1 TRINITY_DN199_c0_g1~~TRINITY_DN199_c0_g1_i3.p1  ORF type:complete len:169 (-),score=54.84 TRINITY_DN199_c0_g1_i3:68-574(-)
MSKTTEQPQKIELQQDKWVVEYVKGAKDVVISIDNPKQRVYIYKANDAAIVIKGKCNSVVVDASIKTAVVFDDIMATTEVVNSKKIQLQANGAVPTIIVDKTNELTIYIQSPSGLKAEIVTSSATEVNVVTPGKSEDEDPTEQAIPCQFVTTFNGGKLVTKPVEHVGV